MTRSPSKHRPPITPISTSELKRGLVERLNALGFDDVRTTRAAIAPDREAALVRSLARGHHGTMRWLETTLERRRRPDALWPAAKSAIVAGMSYAPAEDPLEKLRHADRGVISVYAQGDDYHDVLKGRLKQAAQWFAAVAGAQVKVFVDTAPLMEKPLAERAGLGWQGKHTNLVSRRHGSWLFLGVVLTDVELAEDPGEQDHCGRCRRCLDICPTGAFEGAYRLDGRRCLSYLTIEHAGPIPHAFRKPMGNRIYGCDDCLAVCPWNKFAAVGRETRLQARADLDTLALWELDQLDDAAFRKRFRKSAVKRIGRDRFVRNVLIAIGNSGTPSLAVAAQPHLADPAPVVRGAAVWALGELVGSQRTRRLAAGHEAYERDHDVRREWRLATAAAPEEVRS